jgi:hypothetical protein
MTQPHRRWTTSRPNYRPAFSLGLILCLSIPLWAILEHGRELVGNVLASDLAGDPDRVLDGFGGLTMKAHLIPPTRFQAVSYLTYLRDGLTQKQNNQVACFSVGGA